MTVFYSAFYWLTAVSLLAAVILFLVFAVLAWRLRRRTSGRCWVLDELGHIGGGGLAVLTISVVFFLFAMGALTNFRGSVEYYSAAVRIGVSAGISDLAKHIDADDATSDNIRIIRQGYDMSEVQESCTAAMVGVAYRGWVKELDKALPFNYSLATVLEQTPVSVFRVDAASRQGLFHPWTEQSVDLRILDHPARELAHALLSGDPHEVQHVYEQHLYSQQNGGLRGHYHIIAAQKAADAVLEASICSKWMAAAGLPAAE